VKKIIFYILVLFSSLPVAAQTSLVTQLKYADDLFNAEQYYDAITKYKRFLFFDTLGTKDYDVFIKIGLSYKKGAKFDEAINYFGKAELNAKNNEEKYNAKIQIVRCNILRKTTDRALQLLDQLDSNYIFVEKRDDINYWYGWTYMFADDWEKAAESFNKISTSHPLKKLALNVGNDKYSVTFATVISYILPGAGQFYTGNYLSGLLSLGWNGLWGYLTVNSFAEDRVFDGLAIGNLLWFRFYRGNFQNAEKFAVQKNIELANKALRYLQNNYEGLKP
jgi:tetratricopeptide (TPR) repeat protein